MAAFAKCWRWSMRRDFATAAHGRLVLPWDAPEHCFMASALTFWSS
jgi:hypothetical protein